jgi:hypothetical protein
VVPHHADLPEKVGLQSVSVGLAWEGPLALSGFGPCR